MHTGSNYAPQRWTNAALGMTAGIILQSTVTPSIGIVLCSTLAAVLALMLFSLSHIPKIALGACFLGVIISHSESQWRASDRDMDTVNSVRGRIIDVVRRGSDARLTIQAYGQRQERIWLFASPWRQGLSPGADATVTGPFLPIHQRKNPGDYDPFAEAKRLKVSWRSSGTVITHGKFTNVSSVFARIHNWGRTQLDSLPNDVRRGVLMGLTLGDRRSVPAWILEGFQETGTAHLLAVSGLHVGGIATTIYLLLLRMTRRFQLCHPHRLPAFFALIGSWLLVIMAQCPISAYRAGIMISLYLIGLILGRKPSTVETVSCAAVLTMAPSPSLIFTPGFLYSFGAVYVLVLLCPRVNGPRGWLATAWVASIATMPVQAWFFGTTSLAASVSNLILTPIAATVVVPGGLLGLLLSPFTSTGLELAGSAAEIMALMTVEMGERLPGSIIVGQWAAPLFLIPLMASQLWHRLRNKYGRTAFVITGVLMATALHPRGSYIDFISVGQGDAILVYDEGKAALVDASPNPKGRPLIGYLKRMGISRLDWVLITHHHPDHFLGLQAALDDLDIGEVRHHGYASQSASWKNLVRLLSHKGIPLVTQTNGDEHFGDIHLRFFAPLDAIWLKENDRSISVRIDGMRRSVLLTGDLEKSGERYLASQKPGQLDVLKAGHHGSRTSTGDELVRATQPKIVIASLGHDNRHGFPHREVTQRLHKSGIPLYRTDRHGRIRIRLDEATSIETTKDGI